MRSFILGLVAGTVLLQWQPDLPAWRLIALLAAVSIVIVFLIRRVPLAMVRSGLMLVAGGLFGFAWAAGIAQNYLSSELPKALEGQDLVVVGTVAGLPGRTPEGVHFQFQVEHAYVGGKPAQVPPRIMLSWNAGFRRAPGEVNPAVHPGERWRLLVRLQRPHGNANPQGFDYEVWLLEQNLRATGYVRPARDPAQNRRLDHFVAGAGSAVQYVREVIRDRIQAALPGKPYAGVIVALVMGDQAAIGQTDWQVFSRTGISHLVAISGLHITMVAGLAAWLVFQLWRRSFFTRAQLPLRLPAQKVAAIAGALGALLYVALAGFGVPAQRTLYMLTVVAIALWSGRITTISHVLIVALGVVVLLDPWAVLAAGFWLSFGAVAVILYTSVGRPSANSRQHGDRWQRWRQEMRSAAGVQYAVTVGLVPLTMLLFGQVSLVGPLANAVAIPVVSLAVTPLALAGSLLPAPLSAWLLLSANWMIERLAALLAWLSASPAAIWSGPLPSVWIFLCALIGTLWLLAPRGWPLRWIGMTGWLPLLLNLPTHPAGGEMWVTAFDVGQGMALLVETPHHRLLYDTGPAYSPGSDGANRVILPYLHARGIQSLDGVIISHNDSDHSGGALSLFQAMHIDWVASSLAMESPIVQAAPGHRRCVAGQEWSWDGVHFQMLYPAPSIYENEKAKPNAHSCVVKITFGTQSVLLAGDIEAKQEAQLVDTMPELLHASVLLAPHHGSGTSSTLPFLLTVKPRIALFQVGYRNRYHHPKPEVFDRYGELGIRRLRTDESGAITLQFDTSVHAIEQRVAYRRYWNTH